MQQISIEQSLQIALRHIEGNQLAAAERVLREVLGQYPDHPGVLHLSGAVALREGRVHAAVEMIRRATTINSTSAEGFGHLAEALGAAGMLDEAAATYCRAIRLKPAYAEAHSNLGNILTQLGKHQEAMASYVRAVELNPNLAEAWFNLGCARERQQALVAAVEAYRRAIQAKPDHAAAFNNLGNVLSTLGRSSEAIEAISLAIGFKPEYAEAHNNLGNVLRSQRRFDQAFAAFSKAIQLNPNLAATYHNLGGMLKEQGKLTDAIAAYSKAIEIMPNLADAYYGVGLSMYALERLDEAADAYSSALKIDPNFAMAHNDLGNVYKDLGLLDQALACYDRAIAADPNHAAIHSNRLYVMQFHPGYDPTAIYQEHRRWNERHARPLQKFIKPHANSREPDRRLKIGYVSPDFSFAPVGRFLEPLLKNHDRTRFEISCYSDVSKPDLMTARLKGHTDTWRSIVGLSDEKVAQQIYEDRIDIAIDLTMHMTHHRLLVFARKPAPVQATYLAYCSTTGLETIDYRFTDPYLDPPVVAEPIYSERSIYLPDSYWCYDPGFETPQIGPLPALKQGAVTFGALNNFCKVSPATIATWCRVLLAVPNSRLLLHAKMGSHRQRVINLLKREGIEPDRITFVSHLSMPEYFRLYQQIDIGLDPFPWPGGTTTCDALWMGVPVVTLAGKTAIARAGVSLLSNVGLPGFIAHSASDYVEIAKRLAGDAVGLGELRAQLRERMVQSSLMNARQFARNVEAAYRQIWRKWVLALPAGL